MATTANFGSPVPLSEIEAVLAWVDTFKLSRPTKKINRDFSDAVLLAEILAVHYPKLVEMHNYPPRNSHSLKLNNWMTLNRKVLKKLKLNLCVDTMEQLSNSAPGVIERVLIMVRDKIRRDEEQNKATKDAEQNVSSGGSYYEACGDDENVLVVPVKKRVNGVLETIQQKVVSHDVFLQVKQELKDAKDTSELLKQKVDHLDSLIKLKDERISELQKQLERKQSRRKDLDVASHENLKNLQDSLKLPLQDIDIQLPPETCVPPTPAVEMPAPNAVVKTQSYNILESKIPQPEEKASRPKSQTSAKPTPKVSYAFVAPNTEGETDVTQEKISYGNIPPTKTSQQTVPPSKISQQIVPPVQASHENVSEEKTSHERVPQSKVSDENIPPPKVSYTSVPPSKVSYASVPLSRISYPNVTSAKISYANVPQDKISNVDAAQPIPKISKPMLSQAKVSHALLSQAKESNAVLSKISNDEDTIQVENFEDGREELDRIRSDVFKEAELTETQEKNYDAFQDMEEFKDSIQDCTIEGTIEKEIIEIAKPLQNINNDN